MFLPPTQQWSGRAFGLHLTNSKEESSAKNYELYNILKPQCFQDTRQGYSQLSVISPCSQADLIPRPQSTHGTHHINHYHFVSNAVPMDKSDTLLEAFFTH